MERNVLFYGDNLDILRKYIPDESVDLIYLDPPFNSKRDYNVIFKEQTGEAPAAQIRAFSDFWRWDAGTVQTFQELCETAPGKVVDMLKGFIVVQVKSGHVSVKDVRELITVVEQQQAAMGFLITLDEPTQPMKVEAQAAGQFKSESWGEFAKIQIRTIEDLLNGKGFSHPKGGALRLKEAPRAQAQEEMTKLPLE